MRVGYLPKMIQVLVLFALCGCAENLTSSPALGTCSAGVAQIGVGDGYLQVLCGCSEANGTIIVAPSSLTCNVATPGTYVFFLYIGAQSPHQIVSTSGPGFATSPVSDPSAVYPIRSHTVQLATSGTYGFEDTYNPAMTGQIVVP